MKLLLQVQTAQGAPEALAGLWRLEARWKGQSPCNHGRQGPASPVAGPNRAAGVGGADDTGADAVSRECGQTQHVVTPCSALDAWPSLSAPHGHVQSRTHSLVLELLGELQAWWRLGREGGALWTERRARP